MTEPEPEPSPWVAAADRLALLATRRARVDAFARPAAIALAATSAAVLALKAARTLDVAAGFAVTGLGVVAAAAVGVWAARCIAPTSRGTAAWALDRLAGARERGLTAAVAGIDAARSIDDSRVPLPPPTRLRPADGTVLVLVAALVTVASTLWQGPASPAQGPRGPSVAAVGPRTGASSSAMAADAARRDAEARDADAQAVTERRVREALGLPPDAPLARDQVAERLADPKSRVAALEVAPSGSPARAALESNDPGAAAALERALESGAAAEAERLRREAASLRTASDPVPIPPTRRAVVARYLSSLAPVPPGSDAPPK